MILIVQKYRASSEKRAAELEQCLRENRESGIFEDIDLVDGDSRRWTFREMFARAAELHSGKKCVLANSDVSFRHGSCKYLEQVISDGWVVALTRWHDDATPWMVGFQQNNRWYSGTQDAWGFVAGKVPDVGDFPLGEPGCDCRLTAAIARAETPVWNPALSIRVMHVHEDLNDTHRPSPPGEYGYAELTTAEAFGGVLFKTFPQTSVLVPGVGRARSE